LEDETDLDNGSAQSWTWVYFARSNPIQSNQIRSVGLPLVVKTVTCNQKSCPHFELALAVNDVNDN